MLSKNSHQRNTENKGSDSLDIRKKTNSLKKRYGTNNFAMLGNGLKWSFPNICVTNLLLVEWKFIISTRE